MRSRAARTVVQWPWPLYIALLVVFPACAQQAVPETLTVDQAVAEALQKNLPLMAERANIAIADARILTARLRPNPVLSLASDHLDLLGTRFDEINGAGPAEASLRTDFVLERGGKRRSRIETAEGARSVAELEFLDAARITVLNVQNACVEVMSAKDGLALARENLATMNRLVEINTVRVKAGDIAEVELIRSRVAALQFANSVRRAELALRSASTRLKTLLGRRGSPGTIDVTGGLRSDVPPLMYAQLKESALADRPDLQALRRDQSRAAAELRLQIAHSKVDYTLGTEYRRQQGVNGKGNSLGFFFSADLPVFNRNQGEIERARQEQGQIEIRVRALAAAIENELETAHSQFQTSRELLVEIEGTMLAQARDVRDITEFSYQRGDASLLALLDAQRAFNETMEAYNEARAEYAKSLYLLDAVSGKAVNP